MKVKIEENCKKKFLSQVDPEKTALEELARNWIKKKLPYLINNKIIKIEKIKFGNKTDGSYMILIHTMKPNPKGKPFGQEDNVMVTLDNLMNP